MTNKYPIKELLCANGERWLGPHFLCQAQTAAICGVAIAEVLFPDFSAYAPKALPPAPPEIERAIQGRLF